MHSDCRQGGGKWNSWKGWSCCTSSWRIALNQTLVCLTLLGCVEAQTPKPALWAGEVLLLACGPSFSMCQPRCVCGLQDTGLWKWSDSKPLIFSRLVFIWINVTYAVAYYPLLVLAAAVWQSWGGRTVTSSDSLIWNTAFVGFDLIKST